MKKKKLTTIMIIAAIWLGMFTTDCIRAYNDRGPIFCISFIDYDVSTGYVGYTGLFYRVERHAIEDGDTITIKYGVYPWFHRG